MVEVEGRHSGTHPPSVVRIPTSQVMPCEAVGGGVGQALCSEVTLLGSLTPPCCTPARPS